MIIESLPTGGLCNAGFVVLPGGRAKQTNMFRVFHATSHLGWVVRRGERLLLARVVKASSDVEL